VHKISIVPRGRALGYVMNLPDEDSYLKTRDELIDQMAVLLGGRVAEQIVFGAVTTGAANDLQRVAEITHAMVHQYAMGTAPETSNRAIVDVQAASDLTRRIGDEEQQELAFEAYRTASTLIHRHRELLDEFAGALLEREVLERHDIDRLMHGVPRIDRRPVGSRLRVAATSRVDRPPADPRA
jgi:cell division protease FtsH